MRLLSLQDLHDFCARTLEYEQLRLTSSNIPVCDISSCPLMPLFIVSQRLCSACALQTFQFSSGSSFQSISVSSRTFRESTLQWLENVDQHLVG